MKPAPFDYVDPRTVDEALERLHRHGDDAKVLAGGQSLVPMLNFRLARPAVVIDVNRVAGLDGIEEDGDALRVGALVRQRRLERWAQGRAPLLAEALSHVGHLAIRTRGTVAGSVAHADPAAELPALLLCHEGSVVARRQGAERLIPAADFFQGPLATALAPDELVTETRWPLAPRGAGWGFREVARRQGDFALVGVAVLVTLARGVLQDVRIALFGAAAVPLRARATEAALRGLAPAPGALDEAARLAAEALDAQDDLHAPAAYRRRVARTLIVRAVADAIARAEAAGR